MLDKLRAVAGRYEELCFRSEQADFYNDPDGSRARWMMDEALKTQALVDAIFKASRGGRA